MIEDDLRATMRAHDPEAPTADDVTVAPIRRDRGPIVAIVAAVMMLGVVAAFVAVRTREPVAFTPSGCPAHYDGKPGVLWVPSPDAGDHLVPAATPSHVVVCAYLQQTSARPDPRPALSGASAVVGDLAVVAASLRDQPRYTTFPGCTLSLASTDADSFLLRLDYPDGRQVWVSAPGDHCSGSGNGSFRSSANLLEYVEPAYRTERWPSIAGVGRFGQDRYMVPGRPVSLSIDAAVLRERTGKAPRERRRTITAGFDRLIAALNSAPSFPSTHGCSHSPRPGARIYQLTFHYPTGPAVQIWIGQGCYPEVDNDGRQIQHGTGFFPLIEALLR